MPVLDIRYVPLPHPEAVRSRNALSEFEREQVASVGGAAAPGWLAARWLIKSILQDRNHDAGERIGPQDISTLSADEEQRPTRPCLLVHGEVVPIGVSISHTTRGALVAVARFPGLRLGVDLTDAERKIGVWDQWYTPKERTLIEANNAPDFVATLWSIKQAYYKATNDGEPFRPRQFEVTQDADGTYQCQSAGRRCNAGTTQIVIAKCDNHMAAIVVQGDQRWASVDEAMIPDSDVLRLTNGAPDKAAAPARDSAPNPSTERGVAGLEDPA